MASVAASYVTGASRAAGGGRLRQRWEVLAGQVGRYLRAQCSALSWRQMAGQRPALSVIM